LLLGLQTTFREKLEWLEAAETLAQHLGDSREPEKNHATLARCKPSKPTRILFTVN
jgi:hypothetical protein